VEEVHGGVVSFVVMLLFSIFGWVVGIDYPFFVMTCPREGHHSTENDSFGLAPRRAISYTGSLALQ
jgi:hypothetical protein